jgi:HlyD family secretion protein
MQAIWQSICQYKKWIILLAVLAVVANFGISYYINKTKPAAIGQVISVERGDIVAVVSATGTIKPLNIVDISSKITGLIKTTKVVENEQVKAGQVLIELDDTRLMAQVAQANARLANASANYERNQRLNAIGAVANQQLDAAKMDYNVAQAAYDDSISQLDDTIIKAPIDGVVIGKPIPAGQTVSPGISNPMVLLTVADMSKMQIETQVDESDIGKIVVGQKASFTVDAYAGKSFTGIVSGISQKANVQQNVVYYTVTIDVDQPGNQLKPTMTARVSIMTGESKNTLIVPLSVVKENKGQPYVQVMQNGKPQNVPVNTGLSSDDRIEISSGLNDGDQIVSPQGKSNSANGQQGAAGASGTMRNVMGR